MNYPVIGILGGMGPLASSGFVNFLYQKCQTQFIKEQSYPRIILISDPTIPDRMQCAQNQDSGKIVTILENKIQELRLLGASKVLICCFTAHYFLKSLLPKTQKNIIHLGLLLKNHLNEKRKATLILSSQLLADSALIDSNFAVYPEKKYFDQIHQLIYRIKCNGAAPYKNDLIKLSESLAKIYNLSEVLWACTEFHLVYQTFAFTHHHNNEFTSCTSEMKTQREAELLPIQYLELNGKQENPFSSNIHIYDGLDIAAEFIIKIPYINNNVLLRAE